MKTNYDKKQNLSSSKNEEIVTASIANNDTISKKTIKITYVSAKNQLKKIDKDYDIAFKEANSDLTKAPFPCLKAEKNAAAAINKIMPSIEQVIQFYSKNKTSFEDCLNAITISLELIHKYPINKTIFDKESDKISKCLEICSHIAESPDTGFRQEAKDYIDIINNKHLPQIHYTYASLFNKQLIIDAKKYENNDNKTIEQNEKLIQRYEESIKNLTTSLSLYEAITKDHSLSRAINNIKHQLTFAYEDLADLQHDFLQLKNETNKNPIESIKLLRTTKANYENSFKYNNQDIILLSILNCSDLLIDNYKSLNDPNYEQLILTELELIIKTITEQPLNHKILTTDEEIQNRLETISIMLAACHNGYELTQNNDYCIKAYSYLEQNKSFIITHQNHTASAQSYIEIIRYLKELHLINVPPKFNTNKILSILFTQSSSPMQLQNKSDTQLVEPNSNDHKTIQEQVITNKHLITTTTLSTKTTSNLADDDLFEKYKKVSDTLTCANASKEKTSYLKATTYLSNQHSFFSNQNKCENASNNNDNQSEISRVDKRKNTESYDNSPKKFRRK